MRMPVFGNTFYFRLRRHQERCPEPDDDRTVIEHCGAVPGNADERNIDFIGAERVYHFRRILDAHEFVRDAKPSREFDAKFRHPPLEATGFVVGEIREHQHADAQFAGRRELPSDFGTRRLRATVADNAKRQSRENKRCKQR